VKAVPRHLSPIPAATDISVAAAGYAMLGMELLPQGELVAGVLEALRDDGRPLYKDVTIQIPRRATKTTTIQAVLLGRCSSRKGYRVIQTAQDGTRASMVFMDMVRTMEMVDPRDPKERDWKVFASTGREYIQWKNGSRWWVAPPKASSFRGLAADVLFFDEAGEYDLALTAELQAGALPVMDTRPMGQIIKAGTPGLSRDGLFWTSLEAARAQPDKYGIVDYSAKDSEVITEEQAGDSELWERVHPGYACGLTDLETLQQRWDTMDMPTFVREYLCVWPPDTSRSALDLEAWAAAAVDQLADPEGLPWALGYDVAIGASAAALAAAWFDDDGNPHVQLLDHRAGSHWLPDELLKATLKHRRVAVGYDNIGDNIAVAQALGRRPKFQSRSLKSLQLREVAASTATLVASLEQGTFTHAADSALDAAVLNAVWRDSAGSRLFGRKHGKDISPLLACVHALAAASTAKKRGGAAMPDPEMN
jgi:phage terminase large subunit-like protein